MDEIVIVDWGSEPPLRPFIEWFQDGRIKLVEVSRSFLLLVTAGSSVSLMSRATEEVTASQCLVTGSRYSGFSKCLSCPTSLV